MSRNTQLVAARAAAEAERVRRRNEFAARYRDPDTGVCLTCQAVCECTGGRVLTCRWCKAATA